MKSLRIMTAALIATSLLGSAAMAADATTSTDVSTPVVKTDTKADVKAPVKKHIKHKKAATVKSDSKLDTSKVDSTAKTDTTITK